MPTDEDFNNLLEPVPEPAGVYVGFPGQTSMRVDSENEEMRFGHSRMGVNQHRFKGSVTVDSTDSIRQGLMGSPVQVYDNPLGTIPSTLFTPQPAKFMTIDPEIFELIVLAGVVAAFLV